MLHQNHGTSSRSTKLVEHLKWSWGKLPTMPLITQKSGSFFSFPSSSPLAPPPAMHCACFGQLRAATDWPNPHPAPASHDHARIRPSPAGGRARLWSWAPTTNAQACHEEEEEARAFSITCGAGCQWDREKHWCHTKHFGESQIYGGAAPWWIQVNLVDLGGCGVSGALPNRS
jgi:hypothetical protein